MSRLATPPSSRPDATRTLPAPDRQYTDVREIGPLLVMWCDDGSVWARGLPPLHHVERLDDRAGEMRLRDFAQTCARIDTCTTQGALDRLARELLHAHVGDPYLRYLMQWVEHRVRVIARGGAR